jgi:hypothetical protein
LASGAPPTPFERSRGFPRRAGLAEPGPREFLSWSSAPLQSSTASYPPVPLLRSGSLTLAGSFPGLGSASPGVLAPLETPLRRVPLLTRAAVRPSGKTKVARPSSVPSSGFLPLSTVQAAHAARHEPLRSSPLNRGTPTLRGLITCRSRLFGAALQSFPFPRSRSCSRRPLLPCGFACDYRQRGVIELFTVAFRVAPALCPKPTRRRAQTHEP